MNTKQIAESILNDNVVYFVDDGAYEVAREYIKLLNQQVDTKLTIDDNFGCKQLLADIAKQCHTIDIRVRLNGEYYWFEGDYLKHILKHVKYNQIDNGGIKCKLGNHKDG